MAVERAWVSRWCRGLAQLHGGRAWIESQVGAGTKVFVYFPPSDLFSKPLLKAVS